MNKNKLVISLSKKYNFDECRIISAQPFLRYKQDLDYHNYGDVVTLNYDPKAYREDAEYIIVMIKAYKPYDKKYFSNDHMYVGSYYVTGNKCYFNAKAMTEELNSLGHTAHFSPRIPYRHSAMRAGFGSRGMNGLLINEHYGSYFHIQCILTDMELDITHDEDETDICDGCTACVDACPANALDGTGRVELKRCIRHYMPAKRFVPTDIRGLVETSFIGCTGCRFCCPHNEKIEHIEPPKDLLEACYIPSLIDRDHDDYRKHLKILQDYLGTNEVRPLKLMKSVVIVAGNIKDKKYLDILHKLKKTQTDSDLLKYIDWAIGEIER